MRKNAIINDVLDKLNEVQTKHPLISTGVLLGSNLLGPLGRGLSTAVTAGNIANTLRARQPISAAGQMTSAVMPYTKVNPMLGMGIGMGAQIGGDILQNKYNAAHAEPSFEHAASHGGLRMSRTKMAHPALMAAMPLLKSVGLQAGLGAGMQGISNLMNKQPVTEGMGGAAAMGGASGAMTHGAGKLMGDGAPAVPPEATPKVAFYYNMKAARQRIKYAALMADELNRQLNDDLSLQNMASDHAMLAGIGAGGGGLVGAGVGALTGNTGRGAAIGTGIGGGAGLGSALGMHGAGGLTALFGGSPEAQITAKALGYGLGGLGGAIGGGMLGHHLTKDKEKRSMYHPNPVALALMQRLGQVRLYKQAGKTGHSALMSRAVSHDTNDPDTVQFASKPGSPLMNKAIGYDPHAAQVASGADAIPAGGASGADAIAAAVAAGQPPGSHGDNALQMPQDLLGEALMGGEYSSKMPSRLKPSLMHPALGAAGGGAIGALTSGGPGGAALGALGGGAGQIATEALARRLFGLSPGLSKGLGYAGAGLGGLAGGLTAKSLSGDASDEKRSYYKYAGQPRLLLSGLTNAVRTGGQRVLPESFPRWVG